jgi:hypothetical protein
MITTVFVHLSLLLKVFIKIKAINNILLMYIDLSIFFFVSFAYVHVHDRCVSYSVLLRENSFLGLVICMTQHQTHPLFTFPPHSYLEDEKQKSLRTKICSHRIIIINIQIITLALYSTKKNVGEKVTECRLKNTRKKNNQLSKETNVFFPCFIGKKKN